MYRINMLVKRIGRWFEMPGMDDLGLFEACRLADMYHNRNGDCRYAVINQENGDIEYEVG